MRKLRRHHAPAPAATAALASELLACYPDQVARVRTLITHPRSLVRNNPQWRPPSLTTPGIYGHPSLKICVTRYRVGPEISDYYASLRRPQPAYLVVIRVTDPRGHTVDLKLSDAWVMALHHSPPPGTIHEIVGETQPTYCALVNSRFEAIPSPAHLFTRTPQAA